MRFIVPFSCFQRCNTLNFFADITNAGISPEKAIDILKTIYSISIVTPYSNEKHSRQIIKTQEQEELLKLFNLSWASQ